jgi:hypothetical protein
MSTLGGLDLLRPAALRPDVLEAVYAEAWGYDQRVAVDRATLRIGAFEIDAIAVDVERDDVADRFRAGPWRSPFAATSGLLFAGIVGPLQPGHHPLEVELTLADGRRVVAAHDDAIVDARASRAPLVMPDTDVAIVMATHKPIKELFERQVASIRDQDHGSWCCLVCDDGSPPEHLDAMRATLADDARFVLVENDDRIGFYLNFERALQLVPAGVRFVALSDQDDIWYPKKLARQLAVLDNDPDSQLVASDARVVDSSGRVIAPTFYAHRSPTHADPYSLFIVNSLIGASMVFRRELLDLALPFPRAFPNRYHDHWLARSALFAGAVGYVEAPLHDYVQHDLNIIGTGAPNPSRSRSVPKAVLQRLTGVVRSAPPVWRESFVNFPVEVSIAAQLLAARQGAPKHTPPSWLDRITVTREGEMRELARLVVDIARERCRRRPLRDQVEWGFVAGRTWSFDHRPGDRCS